MKPTIEELLLQILPTCLLIDSQGKWKATFYLSCIDADVSVSIYRSDDTTPLGDRVAHAYSTPSSAPTLVAVAGTSRRTSPGRTCRCS